MKNPYDISTALNEAFHQFAVLSGEKNVETTNQSIVNQISKNEKQELFHFNVKLFKTKFYSFQIIQYKPISE